MISFSGYLTRSPLSCIIGILVLVLSSSACRRTDELFLQEQAMFRAFLADRPQWQAEEHPSGIWYEVLNWGDTSQRVRDISFVQVDYRVYELPEDLLILNTSGQMEVHFLREAIRAWRLMLPLIGPGGRIRFLAPSRLLYGEEGLGDLIKPDQPLRFDIFVYDTHPHF